MLQMFDKMSRIPCHAQYASVSQIPLEFKAPHLYEAYFKVVEAIIMRECVLLKGIKYSNVLWCCHVVLVLFGQ